MNATIESMNDQMSKLTEMQTKALEPMRMFGGLAVETMDTLLRKNYALMGEFVDYTLKQAHLPLNGGNVNDIASAQMAEANAFGEVLKTRANEYAELANDFGNKVKAVSEDATSLLKVA